METAPCSVPCSVPCSAPRNVRMDRIAGVLAACLSRLLRPPSHLLAGLLAASLAALGPAAAQVLPDGVPGRPVTIVVPFAEGGPTDQIARPLARELERQLDQPVRLRYEVGQGATRAPRQILAEGGDDGHTLLLHHIGMASAPSLYRRLGFDPRRDFEPLGLVADAPMMVLGRVDLPPRDAVELKTYVRRNEATLTVGYAGPGSASQLCGMLLESVLGVQLIWVPYTGTAPALADLRQGRTDLLCDQTTHAMKAVEAGAVKAYALTAERRLALAPELPTAAETALGAIQIVVWHGLYAARGTPPATRDRLARALQAAVASPTFIAAMSRAGAVPASFNQAGPAALASLLEREIARWRPLIVRAGHYAD